VFVLLDGLGAAQLERYLPVDAFLRRQRADTLSSVFPPTTAAATNTVYSGLPPIAHGWLGWSLWFKEFGRTVDVFTRNDSFTRQKLSPAYDPWRALAYEPLWDRIAASGRCPGRPDEPVFVSTVAPAGVTVPGSRLPNAVAASAEDAARLLAEAALAHPCTCTLGYWPEPDMSLHGHGAESFKVRWTVAELNRCCETLAESLGEDSLLIVTADHGHAAISAYVDIDSIPGLVDCLVMAPYLEPRAAMFTVKFGSRARFESLVKEYLGGDFILLTREEVFARSLFGPTDESRVAHPRVDDFVADYLVVATGSRAIKYYGLELDHSRDYPSHHSGLTQEEMEIPLILWPSPPEA
jgi:hypothetical protein